MSDLVSVVIPAKGDLSFFPQALQSVENSTYLNFEVIVIDDGISPIMKIWITEYFKDKPRYKIIKNVGKGIVDALNTGISNSSGIFIARLDADDCMRPDRLETQVHFLHDNPQIGLVGSQVTYINALGEQIGESNYLTGNIFKSSQSFKFCSIAHPSVMIRRSILEEVGGYSSLLKYKGYDFAEDFFLWLRISKVSLLFNLQEPLTLYRKHENQISNFKVAVTLLASMLVFIKSIDRENTINTPIHLEQLSNREKKLLYVVCLKEPSVLLVLLLKLRILGTKDSSKLLTYSITMLAKVLSKMLGFSRALR